MAIAALYRIHGNVPALAAVLSAIEREDAVTEVGVRDDVLKGRTLGAP